MSLTKLVVTLLYFSKFMQNMLIHFADTYHYTGPEGHPFQVSSEHVFLVLEIVHDSVNLVPVT